MKGSIVVLLLVGFVFVALSAASSDGPLMTKQNAQSLSDMTWIAQQSTHENYAKTHPATAAKFAEPGAKDGVSSQSHQTMEPNSTISILVNATLYPQITYRLNQYKNDLIAEGYTVYTATVSGGTPDEIKAWIVNRYNHGSQGIVLIGDIVTAWFDWSNYGGGGDDVCPLFYMDLDGYWEDTDSNGVYDVHEPGTGDLAPEVYIGRIDTHMMTYDTEVNLMNAYLAKVHSYRQGQLTVPWRGLDYFDDDFCEAADSNMQAIFGTSGVTRCDFGFETCTSDYFSKLTSGYWCVYDFQHGSPWGQEFGQWPTFCAGYAHTYVYSPANRSARLKVGSDEGLRIWVNGTRVLSRVVDEDWTPDAVTVNVYLRKGWNRLMCKTSQNVGGMVFSAHFTNSSGQPYTDLKYQVNDPNVYGVDPNPDDDGRIRMWLVNGFYQDTEEAYQQRLIESTNYLGVPEETLNPQEGDTTGNYTWTKVGGVNEGGCLGLESDPYYGEYGATYAFARIYSDSAKSCEIWTGFDNGARVWLNGNIICSYTYEGEYEADMIHSAVNLVAGENRILVKAINGGGGFGFGVRIRNADGSQVTGITYDPVPDINTWLMTSRPFGNHDVNTRLTQNYLGNEATIRPSIGTALPGGGTWIHGDRTVYPTNTGNFYADTVGGGIQGFSSEDIQNLDPHCLFYNLHSCSCGRFTEENFIAGAYIYHQTYGISIIASAKVGGMHWPETYYASLDQGKSVGASFVDWYQNLNENADQDCYFGGLCVFGDPTLKVQP